jgi:hypothetical protein
MGYKNVRDYAEGKQDWVDAGLPVEGADAKGKPPAAAPPKRQGP